MPNVIEREIVGDGAADGDFSADIHEDGDAAPDQVGMLPDGVVNLFSDVVLRRLNLRKLEACNHDSEQDQRDAESDVGLDDGGSLLSRIFAERGCRSAQDQQSAYPRGDRGSQRIESLREV